MPKYDQVQIIADIQSSHRLYYDEQCDTIHKQAQREDVILLGNELGWKNPLMLLDDGTIALPHNLTPPHRRSPP